MVLSSGSLGYAAYLLNVSRNAIGSIFSAGPAIEPVDGRYNFLMMGGDAGEDRTGRRPDSLSVISVDAKTGRRPSSPCPATCRTPSSARAPRCAQVYPDGYDCGDECLINAINTEVTNEHQDLYPGVADPGAQATLEAVSGTLGITVQAYVLVDMDGFSKLIDAMGGIRIKAGGWVPISGDMVDEANGIHGMPLGWIPAGDQTLDGYHALWYGRSREFVDDYARIQRQQCVQQAMLKQLDPATLLAKFEDIAKRRHQGGGLQHLLRPARQLRGPGHEGQGPGRQPPDHRSARLRRVLLHGPGLRQYPRAGRRTARPAPSAGAAAEDAVLQPGAAAGTAAAAGRRRRRPPARSPRRRRRTSPR